MENNIQQQEIIENSETLIGPRVSAIRILSRFERSDAYIEKLIDFELKKGELESLDKNLFTEIVTGVIRWKAKLDWVLNGFYIGDYMKCLNLVKNALRVALYQILFSDKIPVYAAINESVEIVKRLQGEKTAGIVNGVLRNISRNIDNIRYPEISEDPAYYLSVMYSHPRWMVRRWIERFGVETTERLLDINNQRPYTPIRINTMKTDKISVSKMLNELGIHYLPSEFIDETYIIQSSKIKLTQTELFLNGLITIQDPSASMAVKLAAPKKGYHVLDVCAAPGGKTFFMAELMEDTGKIVALDKYNTKVKIVNYGVERLGLTCIEPITADAKSFESEELFDIVFADVPCSGLGTLRKKPDIKWKRERVDIYSMADLQYDIIDTVAKFVKPGGVLLYSTCTIEPEEDTMNVEKFLKSHPEFELDDAAGYLPESVCKDGYMQTFPHVHGIDGAFAARLIKKS